jgi:predicted metalloendopeptidase
MSAKTKKEAELKRSKITPKIGCPKVWQDYSTLVFDSTDNAVRRGKWLAWLAVMTDHRLDDA